MEFEFKGKTALITGASMGIGRAATISFAKHGANVVLLDIDLDGLNAVKASLAEYPVGAAVYQCDISDEQRVNEVCKDAMDRFGVIDIAVNNAGLWKTFYDFAQSDSAWWKRKIDINILETMYVTQAVINGMIAQNYGRIINIASVAGVYGIATMADYSMTKGAVIGFTKALAKEVMKNGITVNAVSPGTVGDSSVACDKCYANRFGADEENADLILYLASDHAGYISGQNYVIDGCRKMI